MVIRIFFLILIGLINIMGIAQPSDHSPNRYITGQKYLDIKVIDMSNRSLSISVEWDKSWRDKENWDAAWVVLKGKTSNDRFDHINVTRQPLIIANNSSDSTEPEFYIPNDNRGFFIYRNEISSGDNRWVVEIPLPIVGRYTEIKAYGVEMVFIPEGPFELGTTKSLRDRKAARDKDWIRYTPPAPLSAFFKANPDAEDFYGGVYTVESERPISIGKNQGELYYLDAKFLKNFSSGDKKGILKKEFPKGFQSFYQMKYELTQQQYVDFLNSLTATQKENRWFEDIGVLPQSPYELRYTIKKKGGKFSTDRPHRAASYISWSDGLAWADWMGLRPMTELEFEKSARGPQPAQFREFVWGVNERRCANAFIKDSKIMNPDGTLAQSEAHSIRVDGNVHVFMRDQLENSDNLCTPGGSNYFPSYPACRALKGGDAKWGPLRVGIHGIFSNGDRIKAGSGYYGTMELAGNLNEQLITVGHPQGRQFQGTHGDGELTNDGQASNADWFADAEIFYICTRGAGWVSHPNHARTADRFGGLKMNGNRRSAARGFRAVRTVNLNEF